MLSSFTGDLSNWDTSSVMNLCRSILPCATSFMGDGLSDWNTSNECDVNLMRPRSREMESRTQLEYVNVTDLLWEVGRVTDMSNVFCASLMDISGTRVTM